jgi:hypothetical protein
MFWTPRLALRSRHGAALCKSGEYVTAEAELAEVIRRRSATAGPDDPILIHARRWHLHALGRVGRLADAEDDLRFLAESAARLHGDGHRDVLAYRERHAASLWEAGRRDEAVTEMTEVAARLAATLGDDHPDTLQAAGSLAAMTSGDDGYRFGFETAGLRVCAAAGTVSRFPPVAAASPPVAAASPRGGPGRSCSASRWRLAWSRSHRGREAPP